MRSGAVYCNQRLAGILTEENPGRFTFRYDDDYYEDVDAPPISLTIPKTSREFHSDILFPFFSNMLSEGHNRKVQVKMFKLDPEDDFGLLLATAHTDTPGAVTIKKLP